ncbi:hypothetical protein [Thalassobacillus devorans]|uniref:hypothetical protein n=1 Tax=Thalassobacillus devorans TaxID=279813 RepID=UPI00048B2FBE|nr:hypothetical protein [Thalassobacillus devorans]
MMYLPEVYAWVLYAGLLALAAAVVLRSVKMFSVEIVLLAGIMVLLDGQLLIFAGMIQLVISAMLLLGMLRAIDRNYRLVLEKTHRIPRNLTYRGADGARASFL